MKGLIAGGVVLTLVMLVSGGASAEMNADAAKKQLQTAFFHASELAQRGNAIAATLMHMQHVMNCLEGAGGKNFRAGPGNPCQGQGSGILNDLMAAEAAGAKGAARAVRFAKTAQNMTATVLKFTEVDAAQPWAKIIAQQLKTALDAL